MSVKTPVFGFETPVLGEEADVPADLASVILEVENVLKDHEVKYLKTAGAGDNKKLLIVNSTGDPVWRALSGDATIDETGVLTVANNAITAAKVLAEAITEAKLAGEAVATAKIKALAVTAAKLAAEAVETAKIANLAVTEAKLGNLSVATGKLAVEAVTPSKLAVESVENSKIANLAVTAAKLAELAVTTAKIADEAVTEGKIADGAVTSRKLKPTLVETLLPADFTVVSSEFALVTGLKYEVTPAVASKLKVWVNLWAQPTTESSWLEFKLYKNGAAVNTEPFMSNLGSGAVHGPVCWSCVLELTAAELAIIEVRAKLQGVGGKVHKRGGVTNLITELVAS